MDRLLHEIWDDSESLAGLILAGEKGEAARKLFEEGGKKLVHTFYVSFKSFKLNSIKRSQRLDKELFKLKNPSNPMI